MASPAGDDPAPPASASLPCVSRGGPPPPAPVHQPRPTHSACATCAASDAPCGPPPTYDEAMGFSPTPGPIPNWAQPFRDQPPAYHPAPNIPEGRIPAADLCEIFDLLQSSSRTSNSESLPSEDRAKLSSGALNASTSGAPLCVDISDTDWNLVLGSADASAPLPLPLPSPPVTVQPRPQARRPPARPPARLASGGGGGGGGGGAEGDDEHSWGPYAVRALCPRCQRVVCTDIVVEDAEYTHVCALGLCLMGCWPFCLVPYCLDACRRVTHSCPRCHMLLGAYSPHSPHSPRHPRNRARPRPRTRTRARAQARSTACH